MPQLGSAMPQITPPPPVPHVVAFATARPESKRLKVASFHRQSSAARLEQRTSLAVAGLGADSSEVMRSRSQQGGYAP